MQILFRRHFVRVYDQVSNYDPCFYNVYWLYSWSKYQVGRIARFANLHRTYPHGWLPSVNLAAAFYIWRCPCRSDLLISRGVFQKKNASVRAPPLSPLVHQGVDKAWSFRHFWRSHQPPNCRSRRPEVCSVGQGHGV